MRRVYQVASLVVLVGAIYVMAESRTNIDYYTKYGPGPGFFPFWCGALMALLSLIWLGQVSLRPVEGRAADLIPHRLGSVRVMAVMLALCLIALLMGILGFQLSMFIFLLILLAAMSRQNPLVSMGVAVAGSLLMTYLFRDTLDVQLPRSSIELLQNLGL